MLALVKTGPGPGLALETVPDPAVGINDVRKSSICASVGGGSFGCARAAIAAKLSGVASIMRQVPQRFGGQCPGRG